MFRISQVSAAAAKLDGISDDDFRTLDKTFRNLTQRHAIGPSARDGRADLFSLESAVVMRLAQKVDAFGLPRHLLSDFIRFLQSSPTMPSRYREGNGAKIALTTVQEAIARAKAGEDFQLGLSMSGYSVKPKAWFPADPIPDAAKGIIAAVKASKPSPTIDAALRVEAGQLIREFLAEIGE